MLRSHWTEYLLTSAGAPVLSRHDLPVDLHIWSLNSPSDRALNSRMMGSGGVPRAAIAITCLVLLSGAAPGAFAEVDNVAFQWTNLLNQLWCTVSTSAIFTSSIQPQLHLAQWNALVALKATGDCTLEHAAVAYASHKVLSHFFPYAQDSAISPLLDSQLRSFRLTTKQKRLSKRLGEAVATNVIQSRSPGNEFTLGAVKDALTANTNPAVGVFRYFNGTPPANQIFVFNNIALEKPFVIPDPIQFVKDHLSNLKPMQIPSKEWDENWKGLKDIGRAGWPGRTYEMNLTAHFYGCMRINTTLCRNEQAATASAQSALPNTTSLYDSVTLLAKISVSIYDAVIAHIAIKYGYWFWRPIHAYPAGDPQHAPIPDWKPYRSTPPEPEYPSGTVTAVASGARPLYNFFGHKDVPFTLKGGGLFNCEGFVGVPVPDRHYEGVDELVAEAKMARLYAGAHWQKSVDDGVIVANTVADYVEKHWTDTAPSGVLPDPAYLDVLAKVPKKSGQYSPIRFDI